MKLELVIGIQNKILDGHHRYLFIRLIWKKTSTFTIEDLVWYSNDHVEFHLPGNGLYHQRDVAPQEWCPPPRVGKAPISGLFSTTFLSKTNRFGAAANRRFRRGAPIIIECGSPPQWSATGKEDTADVWSKGNREGYGKGEWWEYNRKCNHKQTHKCHRN